MGLSRKFEEADVRLILMDPRSTAEIAAAFGCSKNMVYMLKSGKLPYYFRNEDGTPNELTKLVPTVRQRGSPRCLTDEEEAEVRASTGTLKAAAEKHGISTTTVFRIRSGNPRPSEVPRAFARVEAAAPPPRKRVTPRSSG